MFEQLENQYKRQLKEIKFNKFYWINAIFLTLLTACFKNFFKNKTCVIYIILIVLVVMYFIHDYKTTLKNTKLPRKTNIIKKIAIYKNKNYTQCINNLVIIIKKYNIKTKNDIKIAIDYFNSKKSIKVESNLLGWIVSATLTLASFIEIAYDSQTQTLDYSKISIILGSSLGIIICFLIPILIIKFIITSIIFQKERLHSNISEDLTYIYFNFNKYKNQLNK